MSASGPLLDVERLRSEFDAAFALPHSRSAGESDDYLLIQAGTNPYALALAELGEVVADVPITLVPSASPALLGVAGRRGKLVPVFDLSLLVGGVPGEGRRWLALSTSSEPLGFAFAALEGQVRRPKRALLAAASEAGFVRGALEQAGLRPIVDLTRLASEIRERPARQRPGKGV